MVNHKYSKEDKSMSKKVFVYGSLRPGAYNYERFLSGFGAEDFKLVSDQVLLPGFKMYDLGSYPGIKEGAETDVIVTEVIECSDQCFEFVNAMEEGAGYTAKEIKVGEHEGVIYLYNDFVKEDRLVKSGDWILDSKKEEKEISSY
jgi:gamma-glutamylcyclotransferase (GGCT)/AIG2-like uncharacterized protein YtfP